MSCWLKTETGLEDGVCERARVMLTRTEPNSKRTPRIIASREKQFYPVFPRDLCGRDLKAFTTEDTEITEDFKAKSYFRKIRCASSVRGTVTCSPEARCLSARASAATSFSPTMRMYRASILSAISKDFFKRNDSSPRSTTR